MKDEATPREAYERLQEPGAVLVDVREPEEVAEGHAKGVLPIPLGEVGRHAGELEPYETVLVICRSGARSARAVGELKRLGVPQAVNVAGGTLAWKAAGLPMEGGVS